MRRVWGRFVNYIRTNDSAPWVMSLVMGGGLFVVLAGWGVFMVVVVNE